MMSSSLPLLVSEGANSNLDLAAFRLDEVVGLLVVAAEATASRGELLPMSHRLSL